jgi:hypothetical protein
MAAKRGYGLSTHRPCSSPIAQPASLTSVVASRRRRREAYGRLPWRGSSARQAPMPARSVSRRPELTPLASISQRWRWRSPSRESECARGPGAVILCSSFVAPAAARSVLLLLGRRPGAEVSLDGLGRRENAAASWKEERRLELLPGRLLANGESATRRHRHRLCGRRRIGTSRTSASR